MFDDDALAAARPRPPQHSSNIQLFARVRDSRRSVPSVQIPSAQCAPTAVRLCKPRSHGTCFIDIANWMPKYSKTKSNGSYGFSSFQLKINNYSSTLQCNVVTNIMDGRHPTCKVLLRYNNRGRYCTVVSTRASLEQMKCEVGFIKSSVFGVL